MREALWRWQSAGASLFRHPGRVRAFVPQSVTARARGRPEDAGQFLRSGVELDEERLVVDRNTFEPGAGEHARGGPEGGLLRVALLDLVRPVRPEAQGVLGRHSADGG